MGTDLPPFLAACRGQATPYTPVWFMRQAGRSVARVPRPAGAGEHPGRGEGPGSGRRADPAARPTLRRGRGGALLGHRSPRHRLRCRRRSGHRAGGGKPFQDAKDLDRLRPVPAPFVEEALRLVTAELSHLPEPVPVIGFAGGPFTLASYLVEGGPSQGFAKAKALMWSEPELWADLMQRLAEITLASLRAQVAAGAGAVQIFESWGGALSPADYRRYVWPALHHVVSGLEPQQSPASSSA